MFLTSLQYPLPVSENPPLDAWGNQCTTKEEYWEHLKDEFDTIRVLVDNMRLAPKRVRRTPSGDEEPRNDRVVDFLAALRPERRGSSSQRAPTTQPPIPVEADDEDADHHAQPKK